MGAVRGWETVSLQTSMCISVYGMYVHLYTLFVFVCILINSDNWKSLLIASFVPLIWKLPLNNHLAAK